MKYSRSTITKLILNEFDQALHPEILNLTYEPSGIQYTEVQPHNGENIVQLTKRMYHETDAYWILMVLNEILSPFEALTRKVKVPPAESLQTIYSDIAEKV